MAEFDLALDITIRTGMKPIKKSIPLRDGGEPPNAPSGQTSLSLSVWSRKYVTPSTSESLFTGGFRIRSLLRTRGDVLLPDALDALEGDGVFAFGDWDWLTFRIFDDDADPISTRATYYPDE